MNIRVTCHLKAAKGVWPIAKAVLKVYYGTRICAAFFYFSPQVVCPFSVLYRLLATSWEQPLTLRSCSTVPTLGKGSFLIKVTRSSCMHGCPVEDSHAIKASRHLATYWCTHLLWSACSVVDVSHNRLEDPKVHGIFSGMEKLVRYQSLCCVYTLMCF